MNATMSGESINGGFIYERRPEGTIVYTSEKRGSDENGDGSESKPFKTALQVQLTLRTSTGLSHGSMSAGLSQA